MEMLTHAGGDTTFGKQFGIANSTPSSLLEGSSTRAPGVLYKNIQNGSNSVHRRIGTVWNIHIFVYYQ